MEFKINIEKKHLYFLSILIVIVGVGVVIAAAPWSTSIPFHDPIYTNTIHSKTEADPVTIDDSLTVSNDLTANNNLAVNNDLTVGNALKTDKIQPKTEGGLVTIEGISIVPKVTTKTFSTKGTITASLGNHNYCFISGSRTGGDDGKDHQRELCVVDKDSSDIGVGNGYEGGSSGKAIFSNLDISEPSAWTIHVRNTDVPDHPTICVATCFDWTTS